MLFVVLTAHGLKFLTKRLVSVAATRLKHAQTQEFGMTRIAAVNALKNSHVHLVLVGTTQHAAVIVISVHAQSHKSLTTAHAAVPVQTLQHVQLGKFLTIEPAHAVVHHKNVHQITDTIQQHVAVTVELQDVINIKF